MVYKNLAYGTVLTAPSPASSGTSLVLNSGEGAYFPDPSTEGSFYITIFPVSSDPTFTTAEIALVTARSTDTLTITRAQKSTSARTVVVGDRVIQGIYAEDIMGSNSFTGGEVPSGTVDGSNATFTLTSTPVSGTLQLYRDGQLMKGGGADYTLTTNSIVFTTAPVTGSVLLAFYYYSNAATANADTVDGYHANATPTASQIPVLNGIAMLPGTAIPLAQGMLLNGKIVPSVASNNLTVAIKGIDGNDPSASNPVYCRIGDTVRAITAALSVTKNAGTNWFNSGGSELATKEVDYFVYLGYNATDGVVIGFARIPFGTKYGDFSATSTNELYCAISTITNATSTDYYENIGRFAATLSAGAGYTWTVPTFTAANLINHPITYTRWLTFVSIYTGYSVTPTQVTRYIVRQNSVLVFWGAGNEGTSNATSLTQTMPFTNPNVTANNGRYVGRGVNNGGVTAAAMAGTTANSNVLTAWNGTEGTAYTGSGLKQWAGFAELSLQMS